MKGNVTSRDVFIKFFKRESIYHFIFWFVLFCTLFYVDVQEQPVIEAGIRQLLSITFYMILVYFNIYYLVPKFLSKDQVIIYLLLLTLAALFLTPIKIFAMHVVSNEYTSLSLNYAQNQKLVFLSSFLVGLISTFYSIVNGWSKGQHKINVIQRQSMESELKFLKSQINPHFLFNTLNSLYALTLKKSDNAPEIVLKLSEMMRYMLYECNEEKVPLTKEIKSLQNYLELERLRHRNDSIIEFDIEGEIEDQLIAPLIFMTFMENAFKHGLSNQIDGHYVKINIRIEGLMIYFDIENSKAPIPTSYYKNKNKGIGLQNIKRRLTLLYPKKHKLKIDDSPESYVVYLELQMDKRDNNNNNNNN